MTHHEERKTVRRAERWPDWAKALYLTHPELFSDNATLRNAADGRCDASTLIRVLAEENERWRQMLTRHAELRPPSLVVEVTAEAAARMRERQRGQAGDLAYAAAAQTAPTEEPG